MKKLRLFLTLPLLMAALVGAQSCSDDKEPQPLTGEEVVVNVASSWGTWNYFSFEKGEVVGTGAANAADDATWKARTDWDIAFTRMYVRTNSGVSGNGQGGVVEISADNADKAAVFANLAEAPATGYTTDAAVDNMIISMGGPSGPTYYNAGGCATINSWLVMNGMSLTASPKVLVLKTADGKYAKIYMKSYMNDQGANGYVAMEYIYQPNGSTNLLTD